MPNMWILIVSSGSPDPQETVDILFSKAFSSLINWLLPVHLMVRYCKRFLLHSKSWIDIFFFKSREVQSLTYWQTGQMKAFLQEVTVGGSYCWHRAKGILSYESWTISAVIFVHIHARAWINWPLGTSTSDGMFFRFAPSESTLVSY